MRINASVYMYLYCSLTYTTTLTLQLKGNHPYPNKPSPSTSVRSLTSKQRSDRWNKIDKPHFYRVLVPKPLIPIIPTPAHYTEGQKEMVQRTMANVKCLKHLQFYQTYYKGLPLARNLSSFKIAIAFMTRRQASKSVPRLNTILSRSAS